MQRGHQLEFSCVFCKHPVSFSVLHTQGNAHSPTCPHCKKVYSFSNSALLEKLRKFEALCRQIHESEEILGDTAVAVDVAGHQVKVPYRLLLTRLSSLLELKIGDHRVDIAFRIEPLQDVPEAIEKLP